MTKKDIFQNLVTGINKSFENLYSIEKMKKRDSMIVIKKQNSMASIRQIDSLKKVYIKVIEKEAEATTSSGNVTLGDGFPVVQEKMETKEFQLLNKEIELRNTLRVLEEEKLESFKDIYDLEPGLFSNDLMEKEVRHAERAARPGAERRCGVFRRLRSRRPEDDRRAACRWTE